jgi:hypothetical protein
MAVAALQSLCLGANDVFCPACRRETFSADADRETYLGRFRPRVAGLGPGGRNRGTFRLDNEHL